MSKKHLLKLIVKEFIQSMNLSLPIIVMEALYGTSFFLSTKMVAHLGKSAMAANVITWSISLTLIVFSLGALSAISVLSSQSRGAGEHKTVGIIFQQGIIMSALYSIPMIVIMLIIPKLLPFLKQEPEIIALATPYFYAFAITILPFNICIMLEQYLIGIGASKTALLVSIICIALEVLFFYIFVFGKFGFPNCGISGIPYGLTSAMIIVSITLLIYLGFANKFKQYDLYKNFIQLNWKLMREMIKVGSPIGYMFALEVALFAAIALLMGSLGSDIAAGHQIATQYFTYAMSIAWGFSQATTVRVGYEVGQKNRSQLKLTSYVNLITGVLIISIISLFYFLKTNVLINFNIDIFDQKFLIVVHNARSFLMIAALLLIIDCIRVISFSILRGLKDTKFTLYVSFITFWCIAFPLSYILGVELKLGGIGVWMGLLSGISIGSIINLLRFLHIIDKVNFTKF